MSQRVTLDSTDMRARLRSRSHANAYQQRPIGWHSRQLTLQDVTGSVQAPSAEFVAKALETLPKARPTPVLQDVSIVPHEVRRASKTVKRQPMPVAPHKPEPSTVLMRQMWVRDTPEPEVQPQPEPAIEEPKQRRSWLRRPSRTTVLTAMAVIVFVIGVTASFIGFRTNNVAQAQVQKINKKVDASSATSDGSTPPSTTPISTNTIANYKVAPDLARYIRIPKLSVYARVLQVGVTSSGALGTPGNVFDTAWYTGSSKPGEPGATLIDGHVSSWTTNGVFYGIKNLVAGDNIEIEKGDGTKLEYTVVKETAYPADSVDMSALMTPITTGKSGLNLITCGGKYDSKSGEFTQRIAVFATLN